MAGGARGLNWSVAAPAACVVHCLAAPGLVVVAPTLATSRWVEATLMVGALLVAVTVIVRRQRGRTRALPWVAVGVGAGLWGMELGEVAGSVPGLVLTVGGSAALMAGLLWSTSAPSHHPRSSTTRSPTPIPRSAK